MQDFETEEQQIEALKKWWQENGTSLIVGLGLGVAVLFGGRYYIESQQQTQANAGDLYFSVADSVNNKKEEAAIETTDRLITEYKTTPYASLASLLLARYEFELNHLEEAGKQLQWVVDNAEQPELQNIARLRLARLYFTSKDYDAAQKLLDVKYATAFDAAFEELKGDIYVATSQLAEARLAYDRALAAAGARGSNFLRLKRQDLGSTKVDVNATEAVAPQV